MGAEFHSHARIQSGGRGSEPLLKTQSFRFLGNTGTDSMKNYEATKSAFNVGRELDPF